MNSASLLAEAGHSLSDLLGVSLVKNRWCMQRVDASAGLCDPCNMENIQEIAYRRIPLGLQ